MEEKTFKIHVNFGNTSKVFTLKESELTQSHKDLLLGTALDHFIKLPNELKDKFLDKIEKNKDL